MALRHWDGFTAYSELADLDHLYVRGGTGLSTNLTVLPNGGPLLLGAVRVGGVNLSDTSFYRAFTASTTVIGGFWFNYVDFNVAGGFVYDEIFEFNSSGGGAVKIRLHQDGTVKVYGSTLIFDSSNPANSPDGITPHYLYPGFKYRIELKMFCSTSVGTLELHVDGVVWCKLSNVYTVSTSTVNRAMFYTGINGSGAIYEVSELYIFDSTGTFNIDFLDNWKAQILKPTSDDVAAFTRLSGAANYEMVDDVSPHDADATRNSSTGNAQIDRFATTDTIIGNTVKVAAVNVVNMVHRDTGATQNFRNTIKHSASIADGANVALVVEDYRPVIQSFENNPSMSAQWTKAEVEAAKFGYESRA